MAGSGFNLPPADGRRLGRLFRRELPVFPGVIDMKGDLEAGFLEWIRIVRAWNRMTDIPLEKRATCVLLQLQASVRKLALKVDEDTLVQPDGSRELMAFLGNKIRRGGHPRLLSDRDTFEDAARKRDDGVRQFIRRSEYIYGKLEIAGLALKPTI